MSLIVFVFLDIFFLDESRRNEERLFKNKYNTIKEGK